MIIFVTQTKGIVAFNENSAISGALTDDNKVSIILNDTYILGKYDTQEEAVAVIEWIADSIASHDSINMSIVMPTFAEENDNAEIDRSGSSKEDT